MKYQKNDGWAIEMGIITITKDVELIPEGMQEVIRTIQAPFKIMKHKQRCSFPFEQLVREKELLQGMMQHLHMKQPKAKPDPPSPQVSGLTSS